MNRIIGAGVLLAVVPSWLGLLGDWHWVLDLFAHFRWQYLLICGIAFALAAWRRRRFIAVLAALTLLLNILLIGQLARHPQVSGARDGNFTRQVLSINVLRSNPQVQQVIDHVLGSDADVVFLMEIDQQWLLALEALRAKYPHLIAQPRPDNFGVALFSRIPWERAGLLALGGANVPSIEVSMTHQGHGFLLIGTHPPPPVGKGNAAMRDEQLGLLADHVSRLNAPVLVVGDLNATPWSAGMRRATTGRLGLRSLDPPWTPTWRVSSIFAIPIDHALATAPFIITRRSVGPDVGSDHRPLAITVGWAGREL